MHNQHVDAQINIAGRFAVSVVRIVSVELTMVVVVGREIVVAGLVTEPASVGPREEVNIQLMRARNLVGEK